MQGPGPGQGQEQVQELQATAMVMPELEMPRCLSCLLVFACSYAVSPLAILSLSTGVIQQRQLQQQPLVGLLVLAPLQQQQQQRVMQGYAQAPAQKESLAVSLPP